LLLHHLHAQLRRHLLQLRQLLQRLHLLVRLLLV
jgi:hypothetical protein